MNFWFFTTNVVTSQNEIIYLDYLRRKPGGGTPLFNAARQGMVLGNFVLNRVSIL